MRPAAGDWAATIDGAATTRAKTLYLLTNRQCEAATHLYEKLGFRDDNEIMEKIRLAI